MTFFSKAVDAMTVHRQVRRVFCGVVLLLLLAVGRPVCTQEGSVQWLEIKEVEDVVSNYPDQVERLMEALDLDRDGLSRVREAWRNHETEKACKALLEYYRNRAEDHWIQSRVQDLRENARITGEAKDALEDVYHGFGDRGQVPRKNDQHLDWTHRGPNGDLQFAARLNRHGHLLHLYKAYLASGREQFQKKIVLNLHDWLTAANGDPAPGGFGRGLLEAALRMPRWCKLFYGLQDEGTFRPATRLLMLSSFPAHARYIQKTFRTDHNFASMQAWGLGSVALSFPEFEASRNWWDFVVERVNREIKNQIYPDGSQIELTFSYHNVALRRFNRLHRAARDARKPMDASFTNNIERMINYVAQVLRSDGTGPLNADSDLDKKIGLLKRSARAFNRPDWLYIATNGKEGRRPDGPPSRCLPWAGQMVSRSGWDENAHWSYFDMGRSSASGHGHPDKLHLSITANGRHLLVDTGRFAYQGKIAQKYRGSYVNHSRSQNVLLIDGNSQKFHPSKAKQPVNDQRWTINEAYDRATGTVSAFENVDGDVTHERTVHYRRGQFWLVLDRVSTDRPRTIEALWHLHPSCSVSAEGRQVLTDDANTGNLRIVPYRDAVDGMEILNGQMNPVPMGWYSSNYGSVTPTNVAVYKAKIDRGTTTFAWLMVPADGAVPEASINRVTTRDGSTSVELQVNREQEPRTIRVRHP